MSWGQLLFSFDGRIGRGAYWAFVVAVLALFLILGCVMFFTTDMSSGQPSGGIGSVLIVIASLAVIWPSLAVQAKRWHDVDKSAWWISDRPGAGGRRPDRAGVQRFPARHAGT